MHRKKKRNYKRHPQAQAFSKPRGVRGHMPHRTLQMKTAGIDKLDIFRIFAAALVVAVHTSPLASVSDSADFFLTRVLARIAVPFFFMVTGQFVVGDFFFSKNVPFQKVLRYEKKTALLYGIAILIYIPIGIYAGQYQKLNAAGALRMLVFDGTFYHLWYFPACMLGVLLVYLMSRILAPMPALAAALALYAIGLFGDSYYGLVQNVSAIADIYAAGFGIFSYTRNGIFLAPVFLILGAMAGKRQKTGDIRAGLRTVAGKRQKTGDIRIFLAALAISFLGMTEEAFLLRHFELQRHDSMYVLLVPVMVCLYAVLLSDSGSRAGRSGNVTERQGTRLRPMCMQEPQVMETLQKGTGCLQPMREPQAEMPQEGTGRLYPMQNPQVVRTASAWIYILHPAVIVLVRAAAKVLGLTPLLVDNSLVHYFVVFICSGGIAVMIALFKKRPKKNNFRRGRAWMELDHKALAQNVDTLRGRLPKTCKLMPAVKADAYGHGAVLIAKELQKMGVDSFCAACVQEGVKLRQKGIKGEILILGYTHPKQFQLLHRYHLTQTVVDYPYAVQLNQYGGKIHVHIGIDTGMHRLGERSENLEQIFAIFQMKHLIVDGVFTHLCASDTEKLRDKEFTDLQAEAFYEVIRGLEAAGVPCPKIHMQASYGVLNYPKLSGDYARVGIALYGVLSTKEDTEKWQELLKPVLSLKARVATVKTLYEGESAGYGMQFTAGADMKIATLAIGYADGLPRALSGGVGSVLIHGQKAPVIGRICMDQTIVDVSGIEGVRAGDTAVLIGHSGELEISACDVAEQAGTITNEILSRMGTRLERVVV